MIILKIEVIVKWIINNLKKSVKMDVNFKTLSSIKTVKKSKRTPKNVVKKVLFKVSNREYL